MEEILIRRVWQGKARNIHFNYF